MAGIGEGMIIDVYIHDFSSERTLDMLDPQERDAAIMLGLPLTYAGRDRSPSAMRYFVDNTLPRTSADPLRITSAILASQFRTPTNATLPVADIKTHQDWIRPTQVIKALLGLSVGVGPKVIQVGDDLVLLDGNHRVTAARMRGDPLIDVTLAIGGD